jgi:uncharacterized membrane protein YdjX (TVP38/TMEM64 family)
LLVMKFLMKLRKLKPLLLVLFIVVLIYLGRIFDFNALKESIASFGVLAPVVFMFVYAAITVMFVPATPFSILGGTIFGVGLGTLYSVIGATLGAAIAFLLVKWLGAKHFQKILSKTNLAKYNDRIEKHGFETILLLRLIPLFPFNALNFAMGLTKVKYRDFLLGTFVGIIPGAFVLVYIGSLIGDFSLRGMLLDPMFYVFLLTFVLLSAVGIVYKRRGNK